MSVSTRIRRHLRGNAVGYVALFLIVSGGTAYATHPGGENTISTGDIINGQVQQPDIGFNAVNGPRIINQSVKDEDLAPGTVKGSKIEDDSITGADVNESSLQGVVKGSGSRIAFPRVTITGDDLDKSVITVPGVGSLVANCVQGGPNDVGITFVYRNLSLTGTQMVVSTRSSEGSTTQTTDGSSLGSNGTQTIAFATSTGANFGRWLEIQAANGFTGPPATFRIASLTRPAGTTDCAVIGEVLFG